MKKVIQPLIGLLVLVISCRPSEEQIQKSMNRIAVVLFEKGDTATIPFGKFRNYYQDEISEQIFSDDLVAGRKFAIAFDSDSNAIYATDVLRPRGRSFPSYLSIKPGGDTVVAVPVIWKIADVLKTY